MLKLKKYKYIFKFFIFLLPSCALAWETESDKDTVKQAIQDIFKIAIKPLENGCFSVPFVVKDILLKASKNRNIQLGRELIQEAFDLDVSVLINEKPIYYPAGNGYDLCKRGFAANLIIQNWPNLLSKNSVEEAFRASVDLIAQPGSLESLLMNPCLVEPNLALSILKNKPEFVADNLLETTFRNLSTMYEKNKNDPMRFFDYQGLDRFRKENAPLVTCILNERGHVISKDLIQSLYEHAAVDEKNILIDGGIPKIIENYSISKGKDRGLVLREPIEQFQKKPKRNKHGYSDRCTIF